MNTIKEYKQCYIYVLKDPRDMEVRYVGRSTDLKRRLIDHCNLRNNKENKRTWILELRKLGLRPLIEQVDKCNDNWEERETHWIAFYRNIGSDLFNIDPGGYVRAEFSETHKTKLSLAAKGKSNTAGKKHKASWFEKRCKKVINIATQQVYTNCRVAAEENNIHESTMYRFLNNPEINKTNFRFL